MKPYTAHLLSRLLKDYIMSDARIKRQMNFNILKLVSINHIKGIRHSLSLPVHGQRTRTNAGTQRTRKLKQYNVSPKVSSNTKSKGKAKIKNMKGKKKVKK